MFGEDRGASAQLARLRRQNTDLENKTALQAQEREQLLQALKRRGISLSSLKADDGNSRGTADALTAAQQERNDALAAAAAAHADAERAQKREHAKSLEIASLQRALKEATQRADAGSKYLQRKVSMEVGAAEAQVKRLQAEAAQRTKAQGDLQVRLAATEAAAATSAMGVLHHKGAAADQQIKNEELEEKNTAQGRRLAAALAAVDTLQEKAARKEAEVNQEACKAQAALVAALDRGDAAELLVAQLQGKVCRFTDALAARDARSAEATAQAKSELTEAESRATAAEMLASAAQATSAAASSALAACEARCNAMEEARAREAEGRADAESQLTRLADECDAKDEQFVQLKGQLGEAQAQLSVTDQLAVQVQSHSAERADARATAEAQLGRVVALQQETDELRERCMSLAQERNTALAERDTALGDVEAALHDLGNVRATKAPNRLVRPANGATLPGFSPLQDPAEVGARSGSHGVGPAADALASMEVQAGEGEGWPTPQQFLSGRLNETPGSGHLLTCGDSSRADVDGADGNTAADDVAAHGGALSLSLLDFTAVEGGQDFNHFEAAVGSGGSAQGLADTDQPSGSSTAAGGAATEGATMADNQIFADDITSANRTQPHGSSCQDALLASGSTDNMALTPSEALALKSASSGKENATSVSAGVTSVQIEVSRSQSGERSDRSLSATTDASSALTVVLPDFNTAKRLCEGEDGQMQHRYALRSKPIP